MQTTQNESAQPTVEFGLLTRPETALALRYSVPTLKRWEKNGRGPHPIRMGTRVYYRRAEIERWLTEHEAGARGQLHTGGRANG